MGVLALSERVDVTLFLRRPIPPRPFLRRRTLFLRENCLFFSLRVSRRSRELRSEIGGLAIDLLTMVADLPWAEFLVFGVEGDLSVLRVFVWGVVRFSSPFVWSVLGFVASKVHFSGFRAGPPICVE